MAPQILRSRFVRIANAKNVAGEMLVRVNHSHNTRNMIHIEYCLSHSHSAVSIANFLSAMFPHNNFRPIAEKMLAKSDFEFSYFFVRLTITNMKNQLDADKCSGNLEKYT